MGRGGAGGATEAMTEYKQGGLGADVDSTELLLVTVADPNPSRRCHGYLWCDGACGGTARAAVTVE